MVFFCIVVRMTCGVFASSSLLGKKYSIALLDEIARGSFGGFNAGVRASGATPRMLSRRLHEFQKEGLVEKTARGYGLTRKGKELHALALSTKEYAVKWNLAPADCLNRRCVDCAFFRAHDH